MMMLMMNDDDDDDDDDDQDSFSRERARQAPRSGPNVLKGKTALSLDKVTEQPVVSHVKSRQDLIRGP